MKISKTLLLVLVIVLISSYALAAEFIGVRAPKNMKIDGRLDEWENAKPYGVTIDRLDYLVAGNASEWLGPQDITGTFYVMYDDEYLYVAAEIIDDELYVDFFGTYLFQSDGIQIFISWDGYPTGRTSYSTQDFQIGFAPGLDGGYPEMWIWNNSYKFSDIQYESTITDKGYIIEIAFPAYEIGVFPERGMSFAFDVGFTDTDYPGVAQQNYFIYSKWGDGWANVSRFLELMLQ